MGFMFGKSYAEPGLKLHLLRLGNAAVVSETERGQCLNYSYIVIIQFFQ
jgi:hypothetical protein